MQENEDQEDRKLDCAREMILDMYSTWTTQRTSAALRSLNLMMHTSMEKRRLCTARLLEMQMTIHLYFGVNGHGRELVDAMSGFGVKSPLCYY